MMFNERKVSQMAAFFLNAQGGRLFIVKLMKLLYLAERESLRQYGVPMSGDILISMDRGPVLSTTLDLMNGYIKSGQGGWEDWIYDRENHQVSLRREDVRPEDLDELSKADIAILESVWGEYGGLDRWDLVEYTHKNCPEWKNPLGSSAQIRYEDIFKAVGCTEEQSRELAEQIEDEQSIDRLFQML